MILRAAVLTLFHVATWLTLLSGAISIMQVPNHLVSSLSITICYADGRWGLIEPEVHE